MILLSENGKTLVKVETWTDIIERPGYKGKVNPKEITLKQIIGRYHINPKQPCGISSCGTAHNMGYLVVCEGGIETNIGNKCGKRIFGVDFKNLEKTFTRDTNAQRYRENISAFKNRISIFDDRVDFLKNGEKQGNWCVGKVHWFMTKGFETKTLDALHRRAKLKDGIIKKTVVLDEREKAAARESGGFNSTHREEIVEIISGIGSVTSHKRLQFLLSTKFGDEVANFKELEESSLNLDDLRRWNNWVNTFDKAIDEAEKIIEDCNRFLADDNIQVIRNYKHIL